MIFQGTDSPENIEADDCSSHGEGLAAVHELLQHENNGLTNAVMRGLAVFIDMLEGAQRRCLGEMERERTSTVHRSQSSWHGCTYLFGEGDDAS